MWSACLGLGQTAHRELQGKARQKIQVYRRFDNEGEYKSDYTFNAQDVNADGKNQEPKTFDPVEFEEKTRGKGNNIMKRFVGLRRRQD